MTEQCTCNTLNAFHWADPDFVPVWRRPTWDRNGYALKHIRQAKQETTAIPKPGFGSIRPPGVIAYTRAEVSEV